MLKSQVWARGMAHVAERLLCKHEALVQTLVSLKKKKKPDVVVHMYNPRTWEDKPEGSRV
jgi:hypothetical protein